MSKALTLSIIIPAFNEEHHLHACLQAIAVQSVKPDEVIVVDNNSTDRTVAIAESFPFVSVIHESVQGHAAARNAGFNAAHSDIIGRIDADSQLMPGWVERVLDDFSDDSIAGVTGLGRTDFLPRLHYPEVMSTLWCRLYYMSVHAYFDTVTLWGADMAIRRSWWERVRRDVRLDDAITHEDQDVSLLIAGAGGRLIQDNQLLVTTKGQTYLYLPKLVHYAYLQRLTKRHHQAIGTFAQPSLPRLGFWNTLPGQLTTIVPGVCFIAVSIICFPIDLVMVHGLHNPNWLD